MIKQLCDRSPNAPSIETLWSLCLHVDGGSDGSFKETAYFSSVEPSEVPKFNRVHAPLSGFKLRDE